MSNASIVTADRAAHLRIVALSLVASMLVVMVAISARPATDAPPLQIVKAGPSLMAAHGASGVIR